MLYNTKWEKLADVFSLESLIAWLEKQPADKVYCYMDNGGCLLGQYFTAMGLKEVYVHGLAVCHATDSGHYTITPLGQMAFVSVKMPHTFGAALRRARKALAKP